MSAGQLQLLARFSQAKAIRIPVYPQIRKTIVPVNCAISSGILGNRRRTQKVMAAPMDVAKTMTTDIFRTMENRSAESSCILIPLDFARMTTSKKEIVMSQVAKRSFRCFPILKTPDMFKPMDYKLCMKGEFLKNRYSFGIVCSDDVKVELCAEPDKALQAITRRFAELIVPDLYCSSILQWDGSIEPEEIFYEIHRVGPEASLKRLENRVLRVVEQLKSVVNK